MKHPPLHPIVLALGLAFAPASAVLAQQTVEFNSDKVSSTIYGNGDNTDGTGGYNTKPASGNTVNAGDGAKTTGDVYGGRTDSGEAAGNTVNIGGTADIGGYVPGGRSNGAPVGGKASVSGNRVNMSGGKVGDSIEGAGSYNASGDAEAKVNHVVITSGEVELVVQGGSANSNSGTATASNNEASITGGTVGNAVRGGFAWSDSGTAAALDNTVSLGGAGQVGWIEGGFAWSDSGIATALDNEVSITGGTVDNDVRSGSAWSDSGTATASGNTVSLGDAGRVGWIEGGYAWSWSATATASNNEVSITGGTVNDDVQGGHAESNSAATASNNTVNIGGAANIAGTVWGAQSRTDSASEKAGVNGNRVNLSGGEVGGGIDGAEAVNTGGDAEATDNHARIEGGLVIGNVGGGDASSVNGRAEVTGNSVTLVAGENRADSYGGGGLTAGNAVSDHGAAVASGNTATIEGGKAVAVEGGNAESYDDGTAEANGNRVAVTGGEVAETVHGGNARSASGAATAGGGKESGNTVEITGGTVGNEVWGGSARSDSGTATASGNMVSLGGAGRVGGIEGGDAWSTSATAMASNNTVSITGGTVDFVVQGGGAESYSGTATASGNDVSITGGTVDNAVRGGYAWSDSNTATASGNAVSLGGAGLVEAIEGSYARSDSGAATASNNEVSITGGTVNSYAWGGDAYSGSGTATASGNEVRITGGTVNGSVEGGNVYSNSSTATATNNTVSLGGASQVGGIVGGSSGSDSATATASDNTISITGGTVDNAVLGGYAGSTSATATATNNTVSITGGTVDYDVYGGDARSGSNTATATNNTVSIGGDTTTIGGSIHGGYADSDSDTGHSGDATANRVTIGGGRIDGNVFGGFSLVDLSFRPNQTGTATGNTVTLEGSPVFAATSVLYGGFAGEEYPDLTPTTGDAFTGNTLNKNSDVSVPKAMNFQFIRFGYDGAARLAALDTTPTGAAGSPPVVLDTQGHTIDFGGDIVTSAGAGSLDKQGAGTLILSGAVTQQDISLSEGRLDLTGTVSASGSFTAAGGTTLGLRAGGDGVPLTAGTVALAGNVALDLLGYDGAGAYTLIDAAGGIGGDFSSVTAGGSPVNQVGLDSFLSLSVDKIGGGTALQVSGGLVWNRTNDAHGTFGVAGEYTLSASLADNDSGHFYGGWNGKTLTKTGAGALTLTGSNTWTGGTVIEQGRVVGNLPSGGALEVAAAGIYDGAGQPRTIGALSGAGSLVNTAGLTVQSDTDSEFGGGIDASNTTLTKAGTGTLTLTGTSAWTGATTIRAGTLAGNLPDRAALVIDAAGTYDGSGRPRTIGSLDGAGRVIDADGLTVTAGSYAGVISGNGFLAKDGAGTLTLSGPNTYTGPTEVLAGTLALAGSGRISGTLILRSGTAFATGASTTPVAPARLDIHGAAAWTGDLDAGGATMNFYVPEGMANGDGPMLAVSGAADVSGSAVEVGIEAQVTPLKPGDTIVLVEAASGMTSREATGTTGEGMQGILRNYRFDVTQEDKRLSATVVQTRASEESKAFSEGRLAGLALAGQGVDFAAGRGLAALRSAAGQGKQSFGAIGGGAARYETGSRVDVESLHLMAGLAGEMKVAPGQLTLGAFFTAGRGDYDTRNSFAGARVKGQGDTDYAGVGVAGRLDVTGTNAGHPYAEASLQGGRVKTDFKSRDLGNAKYDSSTGYLGAHLGGGYVWQTSGGEIELYGKYLYARQGSDRVRLKNVEDADPALRFGAAESQRVRIGGRTTWTAGNFKPFAGLAWEHEFDGQSKARHAGDAIDAPDMKGGTGIVEIGLSLTPSQHTPLSVDLSLQGYAGKRQGASGGVRVGYRF